MADKTGPAGVADLSAQLARRRSAEGIFIVGVTGSVASGKSTLAKALADVLRGARLPIRRDHWHGQDFLLPNKTLAERGIEAKKGFPESYDLDALSRALRSLRRGPKL